MGFWNETGHSGVHIIEAMLNDRPAGKIRLRRLLAVSALILALAVMTACRRDDDEGATPTPSGTVDPVPATATVTPPAEASETPAPTITEPPGNQPPPEPGVFSGSLMIGGRERTWRLYVPESLPGGPVPLVVGLHGGFGSGEQFARSSSFDEQAETGRFIAAYPDGTGGFRTWNGGRCCGYAVRNDVDDVAFIEAMVDAISNDYSVDPARVYAAGHSNGAIMALRLACESDRFHAVGAVAGSLEVASCDPAHPVSMLLIHGDADENHPLEGGQGPQSVANVDFTSVADSMALLAPAMGCANAVTEATIGEVTTHSWQGCPDGVSVQLEVIAGANHAWPGGPPGVSGVPTDALDATEELWEFFAALP